jgi:hypothetical protein
VLELVLEDAYAGASQEHCIPYQQNKGAVVYYFNRPQDRYPIKSGQQRWMPAVETFSCRTPGLEADHVSIVSACGTERIRLCPRVELLGRAGCLKTLSVVPQPCQVAVRDYAYSSPSALELKTGEGM